MDDPAQESRSRPATPLRRTTLALAAAVLIAGCGGSSANNAGTAATQGTGTTPPTLGSTQGEAVGATVDGIRCEASEQVLFHIHAHLAVFVDGQPAVVPEGIGIAPPRSVQQYASGPFVLGGSCFYWLHSHTNDGVIHIESPIRRTYTLGNYFDVWNQPLSATQVASAHGPVTAYLDGRRFTGDPRTIPLGLHAVIQLDVGTNVAPRAYTFPAGL